MDDPVIRAFLGGIVTGIFLIAIFIWALKK